MILSENALPPSLLGNPNIFHTNADQRIPIIILLLYIPPENNLSLSRYIPQYIPNISPF